MEKKVQWLSDRRFIAIVCLALIAAILIVSIRMNAIAPFEIEDKCGLLLNLESHTIEDGDACHSRCLTQCVSKDLDFKSSKFEKAEIGCHTCICYCK